MTEGLVQINPVRDGEDQLAAADLAREFFVGLRQRYPEKAQLISDYLIAQDFEGQLADFGHYFGPPGGDCLLARLDGVGVGIVMLKRLSDHLCEMNRMFVQDRARGHGIGRKLGQSILQSARQLGYHHMRLDALPQHDEALPLYHSLGFAPDPDPPEFSRSDPDIISLRLTL